MKNYRFVLVLFILLASLLPATAQDKKNSLEPHRIVFQLTSGDSTSHKQLMKQCNNILSVAPHTKLEVVCHGAGLEMLVSGKSVVTPAIDELSKRGVTFLACEFSIKERKVDRNLILKSAGFVEAGIIEIVSKQEQGWSYIKAGN